MIIYMGAGVGWPETQAYVRVAGNGSPVVKFSGCSGQSVLPGAAVGGSAMGGLAEEGPLWFVMVASVTWSGFERLSILPGDRTSLIFCLVGKIEAGGTVCSVSPHIRSTERWMVVTAAIRIGRWATGALETRRRHPSFATPGDRRTRVDRAGR